MGVTLYIFDMGGVVACNTDVFPDVLSYLKITQEEFLTFAGENLEKLFNGTVSPLNSGLGSPGDTEER